MKVVGAVQDLSGAPCTIMNANEVPKKPTNLASTAEFFRRSLYQPFKFERPVLHNDNGKVVTVFDHQKPASVG